MDYVKEINKLKKEKNAIILAHYYQDGKVQDIADFTGDSYKLSVAAANTDANIIVFCGVHFMAETAKILAPNKKVLLPVLEASCGMANMIDAIRLKAYKEKNPDTKILCYVNSTASVKALSDCCVTSSNALKIIKYYNHMSVPILYCPDQNLAKYAMNLENIKFDAWNGYCCIHNNLSKKMVTKMKEKYPNAELLIHPEAPLDVLQMADYVGSTSGIISYANKSSSEEFIIGTENGILHKLKKDNPNKKFYLLDESLECFDMKLTTLEDVYTVLKNETNEIVIEESIRINAKKALNKMLELS